MRRAAICTVFALLGLGCDSANQNPFIVQVGSINDGSPLLADVIAVDQTTQQTFIPTDVVPVEFQNHPYSGSVSVDPGVAWYDFRLQRYTVHWRRTDGGPTSGPGWQLSDFDHSEATSAIVPFNGTAVTGALVVALNMKTSTPFVDLGVSGGAIALIADIDFSGSSAINPDSEVHIPVSLSVTFANFADK